MLDFDRLCEHIDEYVYMQCVVMRIEHVPSQGREESVDRVYLEPTGLRDSAAVVVSFNSDAGYEDDTPVIKYPEQ